MRLVPTDEQDLIIRSRAHFLKVEAFAGTGKTSTLVQYALARRRERMLYIAFNKSIQLEAQQKFADAGNVKCVTSHGLAFPGFGKYYVDKLVDKLRVNQVIECLNLSKYPDDFKLYVGDTVIKTIDRFLASDASEFDEDSIARHITPGSEVDAEEVRVYAEALWKRMCDPKDTGIGMVHDGYLKLYRMSNPRLAYDRILFDEAQDANPVTASLVQMQHCCKLAVGDSHQQIYSFRGASNAMRKFDADETLYLTKSFRFGQGIADVANSILKNFRSERRRLIGTDKPSKIGPFDRRLPHAVIARANATLFDEAVALVGTGRSIEFVGGIAGYRINEVQDAYHLWMGSKGSMKSPYLKSFRSFDAMDEYSGAVDDKELKSLVRAVKNHGSRIPQLVQRIRSGVAQDGQTPDVRLMTAHRSKGLEFDNVHLTDDFLEMTDESTGAIRKIEFKEHEEASLAYVAATRAMHCLSPYKTMALMLSLDKKVAIADKRPAWAQMPAGMARLRP